MSRPRLLDLFSGAGGATKGYQDAGFYVVGVDIKPQPNYCGDEFVQMDALEFLRRLPAGGIVEGYQLEDFAAIHASPPCQAHSDLQKQSKRDYPELIGPIRELLQKTELPYVIENVEGAPLLDPVKICGASIPGLRVIRHRLFEANFPLAGVSCPRKHPLVFTHDKRKAHYEKLDQDTSYVMVNGGGNATIANKLDAMGIDWMTGVEVNEAIPPAYTRYVGSCLLEHLMLGERDELTA